jgi:4-alpha-glucanotransferase
MTNGSAAEASRAERRSGILLHPTSLPGKCTGDLGENAYRFVDWLVATGQSYWQILPLGPVDTGGSPYNGLSALAGNPLLVSPDLLLAEGLVDIHDVTHNSFRDAERVDFPAVMRWKDELLGAAHRTFRSRPGGALAVQFDEFLLNNETWLPDYTLFRAARDYHRGAAWMDWAPDLKVREPEAIERWRSLLAEEIERYAFQQFLFDRQWRRLRLYANQRGIRVIGDLPIFVSLDSADVWANPGIFQLDDDGAPTVVAGVPPDYFSATGQRWGNPLYRWDVLKERGYDWWVERFRRAFEFVDLLRIDHFRGFESYWEIRADEETAVNGRWVDGPGRAFFHEIERRLGSLPLIAEDLGMITREVELLRDELGFPGMRVLQFAFDGDPRNPHLPENCPPASVAYTGTHDNDTIAGWWAGLAREERRLVQDWLDHRPPTNWTFIDAVFGSAASIAVVPLQDVLDLGSEARMNTPGVASANWTWRMRELPPRECSERLRDVTARTGRLGRGSDSEKSPRHAEND